jgi:C1A family cysteine protease
MTSVKDQGQCGSCWTFAAIGLVEGQIKIKNGTTYDFSEQ